MSEAPGVAIEQVSETVLLVMDIQSVIVEPRKSQAVTTAT